MIQWEANKMVRDPGGGQFARASSLLFFFIATLIILAGAALEALSEVSPLQVGGNLLLLLFVALLAWLFYRARGRLH